jgi:hypothetical protein
MQQVSCPTAADQFTILNEAMNLSVNNKVICTIFILEYKNSQFGLTGDEIWNKGLQKKT